MKRLVLNGLRRLGVQLQRVHDPYVDAKRFLGNRVEHVIDGGAHKGTITAKLLDVFPTATVHGFEPQSEQFSVLTRRFASTKRVRLNNVALGREQGVVRLNINKDCYSSLLATLDPTGMEATGETQEVRLTSLDIWSRENRIVPELIKLDLQGFELACLQGAQSLLQGGVKAVITEINFRPRYEGSCVFHEVSSFLWEQGFQFFRPYEVWGGAHGEWQQGDALYIRRELLSKA